MSLGESLLRLDGGHPEHSGRNISKEEVVTGAGDLNLKYPVWIFYEGLSWGKKS